MANFSGSDYDNNSEVQKKQSSLLLQMMSETINTDIQRIVDLGCGNGSVTKILSEQVNPKTIVGIDISDSQIRMARKNFPEANFQTNNILDATFDREFDLVFSNAALHWIENQDRLYAELADITTKTGYLAIHQGAEGSYKELHQIARNLLTDYGLKIPVADIPLELTYHSSKSITQLLDTNDFSFLASRITEKKVGTDKALAEAFAEASLLPYRDKVSDTNEREYKERFISSSVGVDCSINRLYFVAEKER